MIKLREHSDRTFCTGINYRSSDIDLRESLNLDKPQRESLYLYFSEQKQCEEILILSTCNRLEFYGVLPERDEGLGCFFEFIWKAAFKEAGLSFASKKRDFFSKIVYSSEGEVALRHIFEVVTSLDSLCLGETQITGQFKSAYEESKKLGMTGFFLNRINREALILNRKVRNKTLLGRKNQSMSHLAIDLALHIFKTLEQKSFTLIGAGKMISLAYHYALTHKPKSITILNRTIEKAEEILKEGTASSARSIDSLEEELLVSDIVIASTASKKFIISYAFLKRVQEKRGNKPLFIIDIALPRDIDPRCSEIENIYLFDLEDIRKIVKIKNKSYEDDIIIAKNLVEERLSSFESWLEKNEPNEVLNNFGTYLNDLFLREEERSLSKKKLQTISREQKRAIRKMLQSISQKILSDTAMSMRQEEVEQEEKIEIKLSKAFIEKRNRLG